MDTQQIMKMALRLSGSKTLPADSEIHVKGQRIRSVFCSIDVGIAELLLARQLGCDAVISHHPAGGRARLFGYKVFERHVKQMVESGVPKNIAEAAIKNKMGSLELAHHSDNYDQVPSAAKNMRMPLITIHSPCDEMGRRILVQKVKSLDPNGTVNKLVSKIRELPEYRNAESSIKIRLGSANSKAGKIVVSHAAYTNGGYDVARAYYDHGVNTLSYIHISEGDLAKLDKEEHGNLIVLGHIASDWLGLNKLLDELSKEGVEAEAITDLSPPHYG
jgi:putative NIF3 family GTP cyclohydrolase 1 type 2